ncbi:hypothetical protein FACS189415_3120 [Bacteroidia bacterium]|nr:hypothetical protein FACS189426_16510 [Bacteroidia bacterium]GHT86762.1 hypothetical protein FACS18947_6830 [Bacteroidia bacterium]GHU82524.1 hypothetical protein FACS189415_3120 [Bacteroidia bacterium]
MVPEELLRPGTFCIYDSVIIIGERNDNGFFHAYNFVTNEKYSDFGVFGSGPDDLNWPVQISLDNAKAECKVFDQSLRTLYAYEIDSLNRKRYPARRSKIGEGATRVVQQNDSTFYCIGLFQEGMFGRSVNGKMLEYYLGYPDMKDKEFEFENAFDKFMLFQGELAMKPDCSKFVYVSSRCDLLKIITIENQSLIEICSRSTYFPKYIKQNNAFAILRDNLNGFLSVSVTNDFIYALYSGRTEKEHSDSHYFADAVYVIDWDGNLIKKLILDQDAWKIYVDEVSQKLYTIHYERKETDTEVHYFVYKL